MNGSRKQKQDSILSKFVYDSNMSIDIIVDKFKLYVIVLLIIKLILLTLYFGLKMFQLVQYSGYSTLVRHTSVTNAIAIRLTLTCCGIIFFLVFLLFVIRYNSLGTQICTWLTIFDLALNVTAFIFTLHSPMYLDNMIGTIFSLIISILLAFSILSSVFLIAIGFQYSNSLEIQRDYQRI